MPITLPQDLSRLRSDLSTRLGGCGAGTRVAAEGIVDAIEGLWDDEQGIPSAGVEILNREISPLFDAVLGQRTPGAVQRAVDDLVSAWRRVAPTLPLK